MTKQQKDTFMEWFPLYVDAFLIDTAQWKEVEVGVYIKLLCYQWRNDYLIDDIDRLQTLTSLSKDEFKKAWQFVSKKFIKGKDGNLRNRKLEEVRLQQLAQVAKKESRARNAANERWGNPQLPDFLNTHTFLEKWNSWKEYKKETFRFKYKTQKSEQAAIDKLAKDCKGQESIAVQMIQKAIASQWQGVFPLSDKELKQSTLPFGRKDFSE